MTKIEGSDGMTLEEVGKLLFGVNGRIKPMPGGDAHGLARQLVGGTEDVAR